MLALNMIGAASAVEVPSRKMTVRHGPLRSQPSQGSSTRRSRHSGRSSARFVPVTGGRTSRGLVTEIAQANSRMLAEEAAAGAAVRS